MGITQKQFPYKGSCFFLAFFVDRCYDWSKYGQAFGDCKRHCMGTTDSDFDFVRGAIVVY